MKSNLALPIVLGGLLVVAAGGCSDDDAAADDGTGGGSGGTTASQSGATGAGKGGMAASGASTSAGVGGSGAGTAGGSTGGVASSAGSSSGGIAGTSVGGGGSGAEGGTSGSGDGGTAGNDTGTAGALDEVGGSSGGGASGGSAGATAGGGADVFGIDQLYPSAPSGAEWTSAHWDGEAYSITSREDENDPLGISGMRGEGTLEVTGDGELVMSGSQPRIYVYPSDAGPWQNLEITAYYQRVEDSATAYAGLVIGARSGPDGHSSGTECDAHTYYARVRNDGAFDFEKELEHPASATQARVDPETAWPPDGEVPFDTWIGFKFVIYNLPDDSVKLEAYRDMTNGENGGTWEKVNETVDDGGWFVESTCAEHSPNGDGESDLIVTDGGTTFIRNTEVTEARYRWVTVREIAAP